MYTEYCMVTQQVSLTQQSWGIDEQNNWLGTHLTHLNKKYSKSKNKSYKTGLFTEKKPAYYWIKKITAKYCFKYGK